MLKILKVLLVCFTFPFGPHGVGWKEGAWLTLYRVIISSIIMFAQPVLTKPFIDSIVDGRLIKMFLILAVIIALHCFTDVLVYKSSVRMEKARLLMLHNLTRTSVMSAYASVHRKRRGRSGFDSGRIYNVSNILSSSVASSVSFLGNLVNIIFAICACLVIDYRSIFILIPIVALSIVSAPRPQKREHALTLEVDKSRAFAIESMNMSLGSYRWLGFLGIDQRLCLNVMQVFQKYFSKRFSLTKDRSRERLRLGITYDFLEVVAMGSIAFLVFAARLSIGSFVSILRSVMNVFGGISDFNKQLVATPVLYARIRGLEKADRGVGTEQFSQPRRDDKSQVFFANNPVQSRKFVSICIDRAGLLKASFHCELHPGSSLALIGGNGYGKTAVVEKLLGSGGSDVVGGTFVTSGSISYAPAVATFPYLNGLDLLRAVCGGNVDARADSIFHDLDILHLPATPPFRWSDGERKRFSIALCLAKASDIYVFDEPLSNVASDRYSQLMLTIKQYTSSAMLICTFHDGAYSSGFKHVLNLAVPLQVRAA